MGAKKALGDAFFKHIASRRSPSLFKKMMRSLDSGQYQVPKSFDVMSRFPSEELKLHQAPPLRINLPENALLQRVHAAYPDTRQEAVALASMQPPVARQFVWRQLQLLQASHPGRTVFSADERDRTFAVVEGEMASSLVKLRRRGNLAGSDQLALLQAEEELQLKAALDAVALKSTPR